MGASPRGMFFLESRPVTGAHDSTVMIAALADSHAAQSCVRQTAMIFGILKMRLRLPRVVVSSQPQIFIQLIRFDQLSRIHLPFGIPERLELAEGLHEFRAKHFWQQLGTLLAVTMFTGERTAVSNNQIGSFSHELAVFADTIAGLQVEANSSVNAAVSEMAVEHGFVAIAVEHLSQLAQITAQLPGSYCGILPAFPGERLTGHMGGRSQTRFTHFPHFFRLLLVRK